MSLAPELPISKVLSIDEIKVYWRNPRRIPPEAVAAVASSIERYGYSQPIVVDEDNVIIVGHTRFKALQSLGVTEVPVYVSNLSAEKAKEYRLVDNRTGEMTSWDHGALVAELREWEESLLSSFFPDIDLEIGLIRGGSGVTQTEVDKAVKQVLAIKDPGVLLTTKVVCPACFHSFEVKTDTLPGLSRNDLAEIAAGRDGRTG